MQNERGQKYPRSGGKVEKTLLPNSVGKKSANDTGPQQGHDSPSAKFGAPKLCFYNCAE